RKKGILIAYMNDKKYIFYGKKAQKLFELAEYKSNDIKGIVASKTKEKIISGIARIINNPVKNKFKQGEILVTSMTRIEFVPLMKKAKAIITNEGGIACHAAIVSREFGIPCIIGTGNATSIIKGGDLIEVDTNNGIVKILKQK
ncbi:MAG: hypothetical protein KAQ83_03820, partial [Nanoarchaeota archaeon]|nr:hypothetical protein [Nanoarchaeota archaeon]